MTEKYVFAREVKVIENGGERIYSFYLKNSYITFSELKDILKSIGSTLKFVGISKDRNGMYLVFSQSK